MSIKLNFGNHGIRPVRIKTDGAHINFTKLKIRHSNFK